MKRIFLSLLIISVFNTGLVKSQSGWFNQNSGTSFQLTSIYLVNANLGFAVGGDLHNAVILKTTNGGNYWYISFQNTYPAFFTVQFINLNTGFAVGGYNPSSIILKTTDAGVTWTSQYSGMPYALLSAAIVDSNIGYCTGDFGHIIKTTNGGAFWNEIYSCTPDYLECIHFLNVNTGYAVGRVGQIVKTTNGGANWTFLVNYGQWLNSVKFVSANKGYIVGVNGNILNTTNSGLTWNAQISGTTTNLNEVTFIGTNTGFIAGNNGTILNTTNGGLNWVSQQSGTSNNLGSVYFLNDLTGYVCGGNGTILKTISGGKTFFIPELISPPNNSTNISLCPALAWSDNSDVMYYKVQVSTSSNFAVIIDSATVVLNQRVIPSGKLNLASTYYWRVNATTMVGTGPWSDVWNFSTVTVGVKRIGNQIPTENKLNKNYPNPFNPSTTIEYQIKNDNLVILKVYDVTGKEIKTLVNSVQSPGVYEVSFDASSLSGGIYFYSLITGDYKETKKMILVK